MFRKIKKQYIVVGNGVTEPNKWTDYDKLRQQRDRLLGAAKEYHKALDQVFAWLVLKDEKFYPTESGQPFEAMKNGIKIIKSCEEYK